MHDTFLSMPDISIVAVGKIPREPTIGDSRILWDRSSGYSFRYVWQFANPLNFYFRDLQDICVQRETLKEFAFIVYIFEEENLASPRCRRILRY